MRHLNSEQMVPLFVILLLTVFVVTAMATCFIDQATVLQVIRR